MEKSLSCLKQIINKNMGINISVSEDTEGGGEHGKETYITL